MILGVIETAKQGAAESSTLGYVDAIVKYAMVSQLDSNNELLFGNYDATELNDTVSFKGDDQQKVM
ncbi:MAG: hypothetical protein ACK5HP_03355 [Bacilli bacterium]